MEQVELAQLLMRPASSTTSKLVSDSTNGMVRAASRGNARCEYNCQPAAPCTKVDERLLLCNSACKRVSSACGNGCCCREAVNSRRISTRSA